MIRENTEFGRFEMDTPAGLAYVAYHCAGDVVYLDHAEVPAALEGQGVGSRLVGEVLECLRARDARIVPVCSFIAAYLRRHPEYEALRARSVG